MARKILLADDSVTAQNMGRKILADAGYEVITVNNGSAALKKIAELKPDLVILDVYMPGYSGLEVCQRLKESQESSRIPVLLTVGKLEPFKPEEAHRVRAEGFIVKPFEASELLSALSKLEDKVVPRAEPSKPGRFARAIAAVDEASRITRNENSADDGWKSRIAFPHQKTAEEKVDDDSTYNPVNRDLRTVVESPAEKAAEQSATKSSQVPETSLDVAALAPPGFPQDVTPEEVAAIAAAAAQIQMAATMRDAHSSSLDESSKEVSAESSGTEQPGTPAITAVPAQIAAEEEYKPDKDREAGLQAAELNRDSDIPSSAIPSEESRDVPMTMAAATQSVAAGNGNSSQWTAVAVALDADEAMISLEQEMQKAYAAFVSEESASTHATAAPEISASQNSSALGEAAAETSANAISGLEPVPQPEPVSESASSAPSNAAMEPSADAAASSAEAVPFQQSNTSTEQLESTSAERAPNESVEASTAESYASSESKLEPASDPVSSVAAITATAEELPPTPPPELATVETTASNYASAHSDRTEAVEASREQGHREEAETAEQETKEDPETVRTTAAAWASWRQIRDTGDAKPEAAEPAEAVREPFDAPGSALAESAAMAVAAGAEQNAQESGTPTPENPPDVASIVDSVLADLRPRLMAEITRKMSEKK